MENDSKRESDIQLVCEGILNMSPESTGDYGRGNQCPFCYEMCYWDESMKDITHKQDCIYLIAKDLSTNRSSNNATTHTNSLVE